MSIEVVKAIKTRWVAKNLGNTITGGIHHSRPAERSDMPYCVFTEVSATTITETRCKVGTRFDVQFDVFTKDGNPETSADMAVLVRDAMVNAQDAMTSPLTVAGLGITDIRVTRDITTNAEGTEQVYRSMFSLAITFSRTSSRKPA